MAKNSGALAHLTHHYDDSDAESFVEESPNKDIDDDLINEADTMDQSDDLAITYRPVSPTTFHLSLQDVKFPDEAEIPPPAPGQPPPELVRKISSLHEKKKLGIDMRASIEERKDFRNPSIYEKLIVFCDIDELGTNYPKNIYDPHQWSPEAFYDELAKKQKEEMDKKEKERKERVKVEFVTGTAKRTHGESEIRKKAKGEKIKSGQVRNI